MIRYRFNRHGNVVLERRRFTSTFNTDSWNPETDHIYVPRSSSPARDRFKAKRAANRTHLHH